MQLASIVRVTILAEAYHAVQAELESAHMPIRMTGTIDLRLLVDKAFQKRDAAIDQLSMHVEPHLRTKSAGV